MDFTARSLVRSFVRVCEQVESGGWSSSSLLVIAVIVVHLRFIGAGIRYERCSAQFDFVSVNVGRMCRTLLGVDNYITTTTIANSIVWRTNVSAREGGQEVAAAGANGKK